jgi:selenocysteine-specific elongation factor
MDGDVFGAAWLVASEAIISHRNMVRLTQCTGEAAEAVLERERANGRLVRVGDTWIVRARLGELVTRVKALLRAHHDKNPWSWGLGGAKGAEALHVSGKDFGMLGEHLASADPDIVVRCHHLALRDHAPALDDAQRLAKAHIAQVVTAAGANPPARGDLTRDAATSSSAMRHLLRLLVEEEVVTVLRAHVVSTPVYRTCRAALLALFEQHAVVDINRFREATGLSRRVAVDILEAFDAERLTRRVPEGRVLVARCAER